MRSLIEEQKLHLEYVDRCDRVLRHAIILSALIGLLFLLLIELSSLNYTVTSLFTGFILSCGLPVLYYNIQLSIEHQQFMKRLKEIKLVDDRGMTDK